jgi:tRNA uridine 5-carbamoylmethylation protein Kti12
MLDNSHWTGHNEKFVLQVRDFIIVEALKDGKSVIIDDTNFHQKHLDRFHQLAKENDTYVEIKFFNVDVEECIKRDLKRPNSVGEKVIRDMYNKYLRKKENVEYSYDSNLPNCIICDVDNTLLLKGERGIFEFEKSFKVDVVNKPVKEVVNSYKKGKVIILSGREEKFYQDTFNLLKKYEVRFDSFYMRKTGDNRKDTLVKEELFNKFILNKYNVDFVIDDRLQVLELWWSKGLFVFNVNQGNIEF